jgi:hypothetical protein
MNQFMSSIPALPGQPTFGGVFSNDELRKPDKDKIYILNLENSNEGGSHWTLLYDGHYFDSYGVVPTKRISKWVRTWNKDNYQGLERSSCGFFVMYVASHLMAGLPPMGELEPGKTEHNENVLRRFFYDP